MKVRQLSDSQGLSYLHLVMLSLYAILLGVLVGLIDAVFGRVLIGLSEFRDHHLFYLVPALPLAGLLIVYLYQKFAGKAAQGMGLISRLDIMRRIKSLKVNSTCDCNHMADPPFRGFCRS